MRVVVTGGAGFIGGTIIPMLLEKGYHVVVLDRLMYGAHALMMCCHWVVAHAPSTKLVPARRGLRKLLFLARVCIS